MTEKTITDIESNKKGYKTIGCNCVFERLDEKKGDVMTKKGYYVDSDGDLYKREPKGILMQDFGFCEHVYVQRVLDELNNQDKRIKKLKKEVKSKQRIIDAYEQYVEDLKEDGDVE